MNQYILVNNNNEITDVFYEYQKKKMQNPDKILFGDFDNKIIKHKINGKSISDKFGTFIFKYIDETVVEKTQAEIDVDSVPKYKKIKKEQLFNYIKNNEYDINKTLNEIRTAWAQFKTNASSWTTIQDVDNAYDQAIIWLHS